MKNRLHFLSKALKILIPFFALFISCQNEAPDSKPSPDEIKIKDGYLITIDEAIEFVTSYNNDHSSFRLSENKMNTKSVSETKTIKDPSNSDIEMFHIINFKEGGFKIVSADARTIPILAESEDNYIPLENISNINGLSYWIEQSINQIREIKNSQTTIDPRISKEWSKYLKNLPNDKNLRDTNCLEWYQWGQYLCQSTFTTIGPLTGLTYGQSGVTSSFLGSGNCTCSKDAAGCGPVAMSQVLTHIGRTHGNFGIYNFGLQPNTSNYQCNANTSGEISLANLTFNAGNAIQSMYNFFGACNTMSIPTNGLLNQAMGQMGLSNGGTHSTFNPSTLYNEIYQNYPVIFYGYDQNSNIGWANNWHIWMCEGYKKHIYSEFDCETLGCSVWEYHQAYMNWGWDGSSNGWYAIGNFSPSGSSYNYTGNLRMAYGFRK